MTTMRTTYSAEEIEISTYATACAQARTYDAARRYSRLWREARIAARERRERAESAGFHRPTTIGSVRLYGARAGAVIIRTMQRIERAGVRS